MTREELCAPWVHGRSLWVKEHEDSQWTPAIAVIELVDTQPVTFEADFYDIDPAGILHIVRFQRNADGTVIAGSARRIASYRASAWISVRIAAEEAKP
jgi:hypothetical protein